MKKNFLASVAATVFIFSASISSAATLNFNDVIVGAQSYSFDADGDGIFDTVFSTEDPSGFNTMGPGLNMTYIMEPGLESTSEYSPDLKIDFLKGAINSIGFGFALSTPVETNFVTLNIYNKYDVLIASNSVYGLYTTTPAGTSSFPEGYINLNFAGTAAYATIDGVALSGRFIIDNFEGTFGSTDDTTPTPVPAAIWMLASGMAGLVGIFKRRKNKL